MAYAWNSNFSAFSNKSKLSCDALMCDLSRDHKSIHIFSMKMSWNRSSRAGQTFIIHFSSNMFNPYFSLFCYGRNLVLIIAFRDLFLWKRLCLKWWIYHNLKWQKISWHTVDMTVSSTANKPTEHLHVLFSRSVTDSWEFLTFWHLPELDKSEFFIIQVSQSALLVAFSWPQFLLHGIMCPVNIQ